MALGKGGSSGNQSGATDMNYTGNASNANVSMPIAPGGYQDAWNQILGQGGQTGQQTAAFGALNQPNGNSLLNPASNGWYGANDRNNALQSLATPGGYAASNPTPTSGTPGQVQASQGINYMGQYQNPYQQQVVDATTASANRQLGNTLNDISAQYGGQYGNGRAGVAMGQAVGDTNTGLNQTIAGLNSSGFNTALGAGQQDAANAQAASGQNAANTLSNNQFNANLQAQQNMFGADALMRAIQGQMGNTATAAGIANQSAGTAAGIGGQTFQQGLGALGAGTPLFGQFSAGANDAAGNQQGTSSGKNSSKGGGASVG